MTRLERLLRPKSICVIGGGGFGANVVKQTLKMRFPGHIWPIHPTKDTVEGLPAFRSIADLPDVPDATFVGVNRHLTIDMVRELSARGAGGAICFAAGFLEAGNDDADGARLQEELIAAAGAMPIIGPNCYGLINYADGALLWPDQHGGTRLAAGTRGVAIVTQSSNIAINMTMQKRGLPVAYIMTAGNQAQTGLSEMALGLIEDERVSALGLHIEGFDSVDGFERLAARARQLGKPIVAMKVGRSAQARAATVSHTASLAGSDAASDAFLKRLGIARLDTIPSFLEALKLLAVAGPLGGPRLSSMSCSGGEASVMADSAEGRRVLFPALAEEHRAHVKATLGPLVAVANPLDYHTFIWNNEPAMTATFSAMVSGGFDLNLLVLDFPRNDRCTDVDWWPTVNAFEAALKAHGATGAIVASMPENLPEAYCEGLIARGIVPLYGIAEAVDAAEAAALVGEAWQDGRSTDEAAAKALLTAAGLPVPAGRRAASAGEAVDAAEALGYPVAVKALGIAHKSEAGAVRLNLRDADAVSAAAQAMAGLGTGLYVERMVTGGIGELIVGITRDPLFGPVMTVGTGGVMVELLKDSATLLLPATREDVLAALRSLKLFPLLDGFRGRPKADVDAAVEAILGIADFALAHATEVDELDVNPLIVCENGAWVADALMVLSDHA
ncbi:acetate--CoA ligase family protein [Aquibium sp. ELW1220]|uniref:acetate--CoA ligase family protein n=1 Tax=Aquibium sp. ELW1220 TaxID=2976766 RepID=UPI0025AF7180|nr:acetate--CoA ligase family protein [Aquibium sp. ELW1220]MDN2581999.1 acetate--CoA ligase family protein [Aquibium sp. ELW1220]